MFNDRGTNVSAPLNAIPKSQPGAIPSERRIQVLRSLEVRVTRTTRKRLAREREQSRVARCKSLF